MPVRDQADLLQGDQAQVEAELAFPGSPLTESALPADVPIEPDELRRQLRVWEQPLDGSAAAG